MRLAIQRIRALGQPVPRRLDGDQPELKLGLELRPLRFQILPLDARAFRPDLVFLDQLRCRRSLVGIAEFSSRSRTASSAAVAISARASAVSGSGRTCLSPTTPSRPTSQPSVVP